MPNTPWIPIVTTVKDGEDVSSEVVNPILAQFTQREQYLYEKFAELQGRSVLVAYDIPVLNSKIAVGDIVYYKQENRTGATGLELAKVGFIKTENYSTFSADSSSFSLGIVKTKNDNTADVYILGLVNFDTGHEIDNVVTGLLEPQQTGLSTFAPGPLYLSRIFAGKLTRNPGGISVYVGYALDNKTLLLSPNVAELSQLFTTYRYNLLDRPAGRPVLTGSTWSITNVNPNVVGWVPVNSLSTALNILKPTGAKFFYNLPAAELQYTADVGITDHDKKEQIDLSTSLPPNPPNLTMLTVNGVIQDSLEFNNNADAVYSVNDVGIWWMSDVDGQQPWASDIPVDTTVSDWKNHHGSEYLRPRMSLQFIKLNPSLSQSIVTSLNKYNPASNIIKFYLPDKTTETKTGSGDLFARVMLAYENGTVANVASAIASLGYNETNGKIITNTTPVVTEIVQGEGVTITQTVVGGVTKPGSFMVSSAANSAYGRVSSIEPDGAELLYIGLHSYLSMQRPSVLPSSLIGKILLPSNVPNADMTFVVLLTGTSSVTQGTTAIVELDFTYAVTKPGNQLTTAVSDVQHISFALPTSESAYNALTCLQSELPTPVGSYAIVTIPGSAFLGGDADINFRLTRVENSTTAYTGALGIVDVYWKIG